MDTLSKLAHMLVPGQETQSTAITVTTTVVVTVSLVALVNRFSQPKRASVLPSPRKTLLPNLSAEQESQLLYPPDFFPGARDVPTPYGSIRCYEFGPATGRKVLLLHGISTSCMTLTHIARGLVARGCRVLLFDLFGRGFSDGVGDLPYDERLFVSQALCVLASSELAWTGHGEETEGGGKEGGFHVVGYSLGGGIAVHLTTAFPGMVKSLVLLAPAGLIREENFGTAARIIFRSGWVPEGLLEVITKWRLKRPIAESAKRKAAPKANGNEAAAAAAAALQSHLPGEKTVEATVTSEIVDTTVAEGRTPLQKTVLDFVNWQVTHHAGFVCAFMSTLKYAPMLNQHDAWRKLADRKPKTVCLIFGVGDEIVNEEDYRVDALPLVGGEDQVVWAKPVAGAHDFPMVRPEETLERIWQFWGWE